MKKNTLYILIGIPGSGKSFWAHSFIENNAALIVSRDEIRFAILDEHEDETDYFAYENLVFHKFVDNIARNLINGSDVIADATHLNKKSRAKLVHALDVITTNYNIIYIYFNIPLEVCLERNAQRSGRAVVPEDTVRSMYNNLRVPTKEEDSRCIGVWEVGGY